jgi:hypothetical protein
LIATSTADLRDAGLKDVALVDMRGAVLIDMVLTDADRHFGAALKDAAPPEASVVDSMEGLGGTAKN